MPDLGLPEHALPSSTRVLLTPGQSSSGSYLYCSVVGIHRARLCLCSCCGLKVALNGSSEAKVLGVRPASKLFFTEYNIPGCQLSNSKLYFLSPSLKNVFLLFRID